MSSLSTNKGWPSKPLNRPRETANCQVYLPSGPRYSGTHSSHIPTTVSASVSLIFQSRSQTWRSRAPPGLLSTDFLTQPQSGTWRPDFKSTRSLVNCKTARSSHCPGTPGQCRQVPTWSCLGPPAVWVSFPCSWVCLPKACDTPLGTDHLWPPTVAR